MIFKAHWYSVFLLFKPGFKTKLFYRRIDGAIQVRSNVNPTFYSIWVLKGLGDHHGSSFSKIHSSLISI